MADARDSKSRIRKGVRVRLPPPAPRLTYHAGLWPKGRCNPCATRRGVRRWCRRRATTRTKPVQPRPHASAGDAPGCPRIGARGWGGIDPVSPRHRRQDAVGVGALRPRGSGGVGGTTVKPHERPEPAALRRARPGPPPAEGRSDPHGPCDARAAMVTPPRTRRRKPQPLAADARPTKTPSEGTPRRGVHLPQRGVSLWGRYGVNCLPLAPQATTVGALGQPPKVAKDGTAAP